MVRASFSSDLFLHPAFLLLKWSVFHLILFKGVINHKSRPWIQFQLPDREIPPMSELKFHPVFGPSLALAPTRHLALINIGLAALIRLWGILKYPLPLKKTSIHKMGKNNWEVYDLSQPLERSAEDIFPAVDHSGCSHGNALPWLQEGAVRNSSWSGLFRTVSRQDKTCQNETCKLRGAFESVMRVFWLRHVSLVPPPVTNRGYVRSLMAHLGHIFV